MKFDAVFSTFENIVGIKDGRRVFIDKQTYFNENSIGG